MSHRFPYSWKLKDLQEAADGPTCFGTFVCGGGSSMGYKLAGYRHLGGVEIDPRMANIYSRNLSPELMYVEDLRAFNQRENLPDELYHLDLLDGSPHCSTFSMSGGREKDWGRSRKFAEGQAEQTLDDLVFVYVKTILKLRPRAALLENVVGIVSGNARWYAGEVRRRLMAGGYRVQVFVLNAATMGVPQRRRRAFFLALRDDVDRPELRLQFSESPIPYSIIATDELGDGFGPNGNRYWEARRPGDKNFSPAVQRLDGKSGWFNSPYAYPKNVLPTIIATRSSLPVRWDRPYKIGVTDVARASTWPTDYDFGDNDPVFIIGMSVPPVMTAQIATEIKRQWLDD